MRKRLEVAHVIRNVQITKRLWWCEYIAPEIASSALPGQFAHVLCSEPDQLDPLLRRPLSFSRIDPSNDIETIVTELQLSDIESLEKRQILLIITLILNFRVQILLKKFF